MAQWEESISDCWIPIPKGQPLMRIWFGCHDIITSLGQMYQHHSAPTLLIVPIYSSHGQFVHYASSSVLYITRTYSSFM